MPLAVPTVLTVTEDVLTALVGPQLRGVKDAVSCEVAPGQILEGVAVIESGGRGVATVTITLSVLLQVFG